ncbi:uncharacterized protein LOC110757956 [Prunus avium]|uniref:Uncharacterized protein LOC110757956 n=1 Tax=Prunus avium TaxID=42229 RepID=A0A6P5SHA1_PRUAV|nr:uncharacterized protein LOC110757956 [Prunus avium]
MFLSNFGKVLAGFSRLLLSFRPFSCCAAHFKGPGSAACSPFRRTQNQNNKPGSRHSTSTKVNRCLRSTSSDFRSQRKSEPVRVLINGTVTPVTLFADGVLRWSERGQRSLIVDKEVLGFAAEGPKISNRALVEDGDEICCVASRGDVVRKDLVFKPLSENPHRFWCQKLREHIDSSLAITGMQDLKIMHMSFKIGPSLRQNGSNDEQSFCRPYTLRASTITRIKLNILNKQHFECIHHA